MQVHGQDGPRLEAVAHQQPDAGGGNVLNVDRPVNACLGRDRVASRFAILRVAHPGAALHLGRQRGWVHERRASVVGGDGPTLLT